MKETNAQKIQRIYTISKVNKRYQEIVSLHQNKIIGDDEFLFRADKIYAEYWRGGFLDLKQRQNEITTASNKSSIK